MRFKGVIFDLDGTLLDTVDDIGFYINLILKRYSYPLFPADKVKSILGRGLKYAIEQALPSDERKDEAYLSKLTAELIEEYGKAPVIDTVPYPGIPELIEELEKKGIAMGIVSNKAHSVTVKMIDEIFGPERFKVVLGSKEDLPRKPDPAGALITAEKLGCSKEEIFYIGDTEIDRRTAAAAGFFDVSVLWGFRSEKELRDAGARFFVASPEEVLKFF